MWRVAGDSDSDDDDSEYESEEAHLPAGMASVSWLRDAATVNEEVARLRVLDRQLVLGDVVARAEGDTGQARAAAEVGPVQHLGPRAGRRPARRELALHAARSCCNSCLVGCRTVA